MTSPPPATTAPATKWTEPGYVEQLNKTYGVALEADRLNARRFHGFTLRAAEWNMLNLEHIENPDALRNLCYELRHTVNCLVSDRMARRRWWHRLLGG